MEMKTNSLVGDLMIIWFGALLIVCVHLNLRSNYLITYVFGELVESVLIVEKEGCWYSYDRNGKSFLLEEPNENLCSSNLGNRFDLIFYNNYEPLVLTASLMRKIKATAFFLMIILLIPFFLTAFAVFKK